MTTTVDRPARSSGGRHRLREPEPPPLPPVSAWQRFAKQSLFVHYYRLMAVVFVVNLALVPGSDVEFARNAVLVNLTAAILIRQRRVLNLAFSLVRCAPRSWPTPVRRTLSKVHHLGGVHVGAAMSALVWYLVLLVQLVQTTASPGSPLHLFTYAIAALLVTICVCAHPVLRRRFHNLFERTHRFAGWLLLGLFWLQTVLLGATTPGGELDWTSLTSDPQVWALLVASLCSLVPWRNLRRVSVTVTRPSSHVAIVGFDHDGGWAPFNSSTTAMSLSPLREWHKFAAVDAPLGTERGYRVFMSRAGDWTGAFIDAPPERVWIRKAPTSGPGRVDGLFERVLYVATGSGIGPVLTSMIGRAKEGKGPMALLWVARDPFHTFGADVIREVLSLVPDAHVVDTLHDAKPHLATLTYHLATRFRADAVYITANQRATVDVINALESRGIVANGALFDS
ncbi:hypothetical protein [Lentzea cavernae]|uniref:hypothetical protein n=1 Tax=Lentzea cavernae TaxID=2020703 RepID=UPI00174E138C|nr:hypothetical protein [Lentzea cavernae]